MDRVMGRPFQENQFSPLIVTLSSVLLLSGYCSLIYLTWFHGQGVYFLFLLMLVQITPFAFCLGRQKYNYLAFVLVYHFLSYSIPKYNQMKVILRVDELFPEAIIAIKEHITCTLILAAAYFVIRMFFFYRDNDKERFQMLTLNRWQLLAIAGYVLSVPMFIYHIPSWFLALHFTIVSADMILLMTSSAPENQALSWLLRCAVFVSAFWYFMQTGALSIIGNLAVYVFIFACISRRYSLILIPILLTILGSTLQTVKMPFRTAIYENIDMSIGDRLSLISELVITKYVDDDLDMPGEGELAREKGDMEEVLHGFSRLGDDSLERVMSWTPSKVPFWNGETYASIPFTFIPRFLWPDKPSRHIWNKFGKTYGYISEDDVQTSVAVSYLAEGYMNFGYTGLYMVAAIVGILIAMIEHFSYFFMNGSFYFTFLVFLMPVLIYATDLGSIIQSLAIGMALMLLFRTQFLKMARKDDYS